MRGRFVALEGPDGVGKTSLARQLAPLSYPDVIAELTSDDSVTGPQRRSGDRLVFVARRQVSATSAYAAHLMEQLAGMLWHSGDGPDLPDSFWLGLQAAWFTAHATTVVEPLLEAGYDVLVDGWVYKFVSKLLIQGHELADLRTVFARVRMPDAVVLLSADPGALYDRRVDGEGFRPAELGMHAGYARMDRAAFVDYQRRGLEHLRRFAREQGWPVTDLDPALGLEQTAALLAPLITSLTGAAPGTIRPAYFPAPAGA